MRIVLITQKDPFYLAESLDYLLRKLPSHSTIVGCVLFDVSPFGKKKSLIQQAKETYDTFGFYFFFRYSFLFGINKFRRKKDIKHVLNNYGIPVLRLEKSINHSDSIDMIRSLEPELLISIAGNQIFKRPIISLASKGCLNLHTALLPKYRGLMPTFWVLKNNEKETGVSIFFVDEGIDSGPILVQKKIAISSLTQSQLIKSTKRLGMDGMLEAIEKIHSGDLTTIPNPNSKMSYFSKPTKEDVKDFLANGKKFF